MMLANVLKLMKESDVNQDIVNLYAEDYFVLIGYLLVLNSFVFTGNLFVLNYFCVYCVCEFWDFNYFENNQCHIFTSIPLQGYFRHSFLLGGVYQLYYFLCLHYLG